MSTSLGATLRPSPDVIAKRLDDATILVHLPSNQIFELNETGTRVWELLGTGHALGEIALVLVEEFEVEKGQALAETEKLIARLAAEGMIV